MIKLLVLTSSTGGGHDMRARSLKMWAESKDAPSLFEVSVFQTLENVHAVYRFGVWLYNIIQTTFPSLHHIYFNILEALNLHRSARRIMGKERFMERLIAFQPDVIVSTHAHLNHGFFDLAQSTLTTKTIRCYTYCGELFGGYGFSQHWVNPQVDGFIGAVKETCEQASDLGMPASRNHVGGFMLNPKFYATPLTQEEKVRYIKEQLGFCPETFILILSTGANSANNHVHLLEALHQAGMRLQVVALCGKCDEAKAAVEAWGQAHRSIQVKALPYCEDLYRLFQCASAVVARPGTGTTSECILSECPLIFNGIGGVMPQEYITVKYMRKQGIDKVMKKPEDLPRLLKPLFDEQVSLTIRQQLKQIQPTQHPLDILKIIAQTQNG